MGARTFMEKLAIRFRGFHGTNDKHVTPLRAGEGAPILPSDPNPRGNYAMPAQRAKAQGARQFAREAVDARGGQPWRALVTIDTQQGWQPWRLTELGRRVMQAEGLITLADQHAAILDKAAEMDRLHALVRRLHGPARELAGRELGQHHQELQRWVGSWITTKLVKPAAWKRL